MPCPPTQVPHCLSLQTKVQMHEGATPEKKLTVSGLALGHILTGGLLT